MFKKIIGYIILILFCISCGDSPTGYSNNTISLDIYSNEPFSIVLSFI